MKKALVVIAFFLYVMLVLYVASLAPGGKRSQFHTKKSLGGTIHYKVPPVCKEAALPEGLHDLDDLYDDEDP